MQRYFVPNKNIVQTTVTLEGEDARHISKVMRMAPEDQIVVCNEDKQAYLCQITAISTQEGEVVAEIKEQLIQNSELPIDVTLAQGLIKGDKLDWVVQKGTELGAYAFIPFNAKRSITKWEGTSKVDRKLGRLEKIAKEASEQSHRMWIPKIHHPYSLQEILQESKEYDFCLVAYEEEAKQGKQSGLPTLLKKIPSGSSLLVVVGPEGGFDTEEIDAFKDKGFAICGLGKRILRAETAPLYLLSALSFYYELQRGE